MRISKPAFFLSIAFACSVSAAVGYVSSSSNLDFGYPTFRSKVRKPIKPYSKDPYLMQSYRQEVEQYVEDSKKYIKAGNSDIEQIAEEKAAAVRSANEVVSEYNSFVRFGY